MINQQLSDEFERWLQEPDASLVHAYGIISNAHEEIDTIRNMHGVKKGKTFAIWVDRVRIEALSDHLYLARFDKWERTGQNLIITFCWTSSVFCCQYVLFY